MFLNDTVILIAIITSGTILKIIQRRRFDEIAMVENIRFERSRSYVHSFIGTPEQLLYSIIWETCRNNQYIVDGFNNFHTDKLM